MSHTTRQEAKALLKQLSALLDTQSSEHDLVAALAQRLAEVTSEATLDDVLGLMPDSPPATSSGLVSALQPTSPSGSSGSYDSSDSDDTRLERRGSMDSVGSRGTVSGSSSASSSDFESLTKATDAVFSRLRDAPVYHKALSPQVRMSLMALPSDEQAKLCFSELPVDRRQSFFVPSSNNTEFDEAPRRLSFDVGRDSPSSQIDDAYIERAAQSLRKSPDRKSVV